MSLDAKQTHVVHQWKHGRPIIACCFDPKGRYLFTSSEDYSLQRWKLDDGSKVAWEAHESWVRDIIVLPDGESFVTAGCDDHIMFWPVELGEKPQPKHSVKAHEGWVRCLDVKADGTLIASGGNDNLVKLWDPNGKLVRELKATRAMSTASSFTRKKTCCCPEIWAARSISGRLKRAS